MTICIHCKFSTVLCKHRKVWDLQEQCYFFILLATKTVIRNMIRNYEELVVKLVTIFIVESTFSKESSINVKTIAVLHMVSYINSSLRWNAWARVHKKLEVLYTVFVPCRIKIYWIKMASMFYSIRTNFTKSLPSRNLKVIPSIGKFHKCISSSISNLNRQTWYPSRLWPYRSQSSDDLIK